MFDIILALSFFWIIFLFFILNKSVYTHNTTSPQLFLVFIFPTIFFFSYKLYSLADSILTTNTSPFSGLLDFESLIPGIREGLYLPIDTAAFGFSAFLFSGVITSGVFTILGGNKPHSLSLTTFYTLAIILFFGFVLISTDSLSVLFVSFEMLLLSSLYLLRLTSKSERVIEASIEMFFWTLIGSLALLISFVWLFVNDLISISTCITTHTTPPIVYFLLIIGFGVKIPVWPFFSWLLKAHVEASVEFSILLSGFIVKAGVWGIYRLIQHSCSYVGMLTLIALCVTGICIATLRILTQRDLKRIVALTTVIEMNWVGVCLALGNASFDKIAVYLVAVHSVITSLEFLIVESISKRFNSRDLTQIFGLSYSCPTLSLFAFYTTLVTIGFPGTPLFLAKLMFFAIITSVSFSFFMLLAVVLVLILPLVFMRVWVPVWFGLSVNKTAFKYSDLSYVEIFLLTTLTFFTLIFSICPALLIMF